MVRLIFQALFRREIEMRGKSLYVTGNTGEGMKKILTGVTWIFRRHPIWVGCVILCLVLALAWVAFDAYSRSRFASTVRNIEREGIICRYSGFKGRNTPSPEEVLAEFTHLGEAMQKAEVQYTSEETWKVDIAALVAEEAELLEEADLFLDRNPQLFFAHDFDGLPWSEKFAEVNFGRCWARINTGRIRLLMRKGRMDDIPRLLERTARLRDYLLHDLVLMQWLVARIIEDMRFDVFCELAATGGIAQFQPEQLLQWERESRETEEAFRNQIPIIAESDMTYLTAQGINPDYVLETCSVSHCFRWFFRPLILHDVAGFLELYRIAYPKLVVSDSLAEVQAELLHVRQEFSENRTLLKMIGESPWYTWPRPVRGKDPSLDDWFFWPCVEIISEAGTIYARQRTLRAGLAAERFLRDHGRPPATLEELVPEYLPEVPRNPFTGDPLKLESGRLERLLPAEQGMGQFFPEEPEIEPFEGFRIYGGRDPAVTPVGSSRMSRRGELPVWCRRWKTE